MTDASQPALTTAADAVVPSTPDTPEGSTLGYEALKAEVAKEPKFFEVRGERFQLRDELSAATMMDLALTGDPRASQMEKLRAVRDFLDAAMVPDDSERFRYALRMADPIIGEQELMKVIEAIVEDMTSSPTEQS